MKKNLILLLALFIMFFGFAQNSDYLNQANYQTAKRCVELARDQLLVQKYDSAFDFVETGLLYDQSISDLWYLHALLLEVKNLEIFKRIDSIEKAIEKNSWLYYTAEAARIFYARYLIDTGDSQKALTLLNEKPLLIQSDAEYLRCLAYYRLGDNKKAREKVSNAQKIFPKDARFPLLFFSYERLNQDRSDKDFLHLRDALLPMIESWKNEASILLYASYFVDEKTALAYLKEYRISQKKDPLYILAFLSFGLFTEEQAIDALFEKAEDRIKASLFFEALSLLQSPQAFSYLAEKLKDFSGQLDFDTNNDGVNDFFVRYKYGRPFTLIYDENADDALNWLIESDYGLAEKAVLFEENYEVYFSRYPFVHSLSHIDLENNSLEIQFIDGSLSWEPYNLELIPIKDDLVFYVPVLQKNKIFPKQDELRNTANEIVVYDNSSYKKIRFSLHNNIISTALYTIADKPYAYGFFEDGILQFRNIDRDGNGSYETTEFYSFDSNKKMLSENERKNLYKELFLDFEMPFGYYISQVLVDTNENGIPDFRESYFPESGKISAWDQSEDGAWNLRYEQKISDGIVQEKIFFYHPINNEEIEVQVENGIPQFARYGKNIKKITKEANFDFYWLGEPSYTRYALKAFNELAKIHTQGIRIIIDDSELRNSRILAIKIDSFYFGELIENLSF